MTATERERMIEEAFERVQRDRGFRFGSTPPLRPDNYAAKLFIVRVYERMQGVTLLPMEVE